MTTVMVHVAIIGFQHRLASELYQRLAGVSRFSYLDVIALRQATNAAVEMRTKVPGTDIRAVPCTVPHTRIPPLCLNCWGTCVMGSSLCSLSTGAHAYYLVPDDDVVKMPLTLKTWL